MARKKTPKKKALVKGKSRSTATRTRATKTKRRRMQAGDVIAML